MTEERDTSFVVRLGDVEPGDLDIFFAHQLDPDATRMAAFPSRDRAAFDAHWARNIIGNPLNLMQTILAGDDVAGNIGSWTHNGKRFVGYWLGQSHWGRGVATRALNAFLDVERTRPLFAHVVQHNAGSIRVLEKCGFREDSSVMLSEAGVIELRFVLR